MKQDARHIDHFHAGALSEKSEAVLQLTMLTAVESLIEIDHMLTEATAPPEEDTVRKKKADQGGSSTKKPWWEFWKR